MKCTFSKGVTCWGVVKNNLDPFSSLKSSSWLYLCKPLIKRSSELALQRKSKIVVWKSVPYAPGKIKKTEITALIQRITDRVHKKRLLLNKNPLAQAAFYDPIKTAICHWRQDSQCEVRGFRVSLFPKSATCICPSFLHKISEICAVPFLKGIFEFACFWSFLSQVSHPKH